MTYHRTAGKGGTRNSAAERHPKNPNFNKNTIAGESKPARKGRVQLNPPSMHRGQKSY
jgi:hypothetical protein